MRRKTLARKKALLQRIPHEDYIKLSKYVEKVYLSDYDLKILMARKFSNFFLGMIPLVKEENGGRVQYLYQQKFSGRKEPLIISNRALGAMKRRIKQGEFKKILLADDIIIHGRTLDIAYCRVKDWLEEAGITGCELKVYAYAESEEGFLDDVKFKDDFENGIPCSIDLKRCISNEIVNALYSVGQAYISYVPICSYSYDSELGKITRRLLADEKNKFSIQKSVDMEVAQIKSYVYVEEENKELIMSSSIRVYDYSNLNEFILVPMVILNPLERKNLEDIFSTVEELLDKKYCQELKETNDSELMFRVVVYILSALWGWIYTKNCIKQEWTLLAYNVEQQKMDFGKSILNDQIIKGLSCEQLEIYFEKASQKYRAVEKIDQIINEEKDFQRLEEEMKEVYKEFSDGDEERQYAVELLEKYLYINGEIDEKRCKNQSIHEDTRRLIGYPLCKLFSMMKNYGEGCDKAILHAIDLGRGSIVPKLLNGQYFLMVIYAGEQNYKYYEDLYFPFLYGLYMVEESCKNVSQKNCTKLKREFLEEYSKYWRGQKKFLIDSDINKMFKMQVSKQFKEILIKTVWDYYSKPELDYVISLLKKIEEVEVTNDKRLLGNR